MLTQAQQRKAAREFAKRWEGRGYEKGDSDTFWITLLSEVYGVENPADFIIFEDKVMLDNTSFIDGRIPSTHVLIEQKSIDKDLTKPFKQSDGSLLSPFQQAKRYSAELPYSERPRWIVVSNFKEFHIFDMEKPGGEPEVVLLKDLEEDYYRLNFLVDEGDHYIKRATEVSIQAGELVGILYDALLKQYNDPDDEETQKDLNILCVRLVFCFYAEDAGLFGRHNMFHDYLAKHKDSNSMFREALLNLFGVLDQEEHERDPYASEDLLAFPYVNGGLFEKDDIVIPRINEEIIDIILDKASAGFNWSNISPTVFGGVFESTLNPETRRSGGMHYTSIENIHKVIDPLFMDDLREEFKEIKALKTLTIKKRRYEELQDKMASLVFLDPAAGSGNFLTETYLSLRKLENEILKELHGKQVLIGAVKNPIKVSISQFYGIEINDFAVSVARTALWIAESQMMKETEDIVNMDLDFLPLETYPNIVEGNALRMDWEEVVPRDKLDYIMGNPPFVGARMMDTPQKDDMYEVFGNLKGVGNLDFVSAWYKKACDYINQTNIHCAFVSTNSIAQGEQVAILWQPLFEKYGIVINFAYQSFVWDSEASMKAHVHVVIIGFSQKERHEKFIYSSGSRKEKASYINAYLVDAPNIFISSRRTPLSDVSRMSYGSFALDDGAFTISEEEYKEILKKEPFIKSVLKPFIGAKEFINKINRYCVWLDYGDIDLIKRSRILTQKIQHVKNWRSQSTRKNTLEAANTPMKFAEIRQPDSDYLGVPVVSSENRKYIPIGFLSKEIIASNQLFVVPDAEIYHFSILSSNVHNAWMRIVGGRLKSDYRYSASIVYNNFPWIILTDEQKNELTMTGKRILRARELYPDWSLADLYNELTMPPELRKAHQENDKAVMSAYGFDWRTMTSAECVAELMKMYQNLVKQA